MKYLTLLTLTSIFLSCSKKDDAKPKHDPPPSVVNITATTDVLNGITRPKFTITLNVPDTSATQLFMLSVTKKFSPPVTIIKPKSGTYTIVDTYNVYPLQPDYKDYTPFFLMSDNTAIYNSSIQIN